MGIGTKLRKASNRTNDDVMLMHWCPGCESPHGIRIQRPQGSTIPIWTFDGNYENPTFGPSIRVFVTHITDDDDKPLPQPVEETLCHYFIKKGREIKPELKPDVSYIDFCGDSPHALKGTQEELPVWPYAPGLYGGIEDL